MTRGFLLACACLVAGCSETTVNNYGGSGGEAQDASTGGAGASSGGSGSGGTTATGGAQTGGETATGGSSGIDAGTGGTVSTGGTIGTGGEAADANPCNGFPGTKMCAEGCESTDNPDYGCGSPSCIACSPGVGNTLNSTGGVVCIGGECAPECAPEYHAYNGGCFLNDCPAGQVRCGATTGNTRLCVPIAPSNACGQTVDGTPSGILTCAPNNSPLCTCCVAQNQCGVTQIGGPCQ